MSRYAREQKAWVSRRTGCRYIYVSDVFRLVKGIRRFRRSVDSLSAAE
jgi:hypothetical protein